MWLFICLLPLLWLDSAQLINGEGSGTMDENGRPDEMAGFDTIDGPYFFYANVFSYYLRCDMYRTIRHVHETTRELTISWLYGETPTASTAPRQTSLHRPNVALYYHEMDEYYYLSYMYMSTFQVKRGDEGDDNCRQRVDNGYYHVAVNGTILPFYYFLQFSNVTLCSTEVNYTDGIVTIRWELNGFPLPLLYIEHYYETNSSSLSQRNVGFSVSGYYLERNNYKPHIPNDDVIVTKSWSGNSVSILARFLYNQLLSVRLVAVTENDFPSHHRILHHLSGSPYLLITDVVGHNFTLLCLCSGCQNLLIWKNNIRLSNIQTNIVDIHAQSVQHYGTYGVNNPSLSSVIEVNKPGNYSCTSGLSHPQLPLGTAFVIIPSQPQIIQQPKEFLTVISGETVSLNCTANGTDPLIIDWLQVQGNTSKLIDSDQYMITSNSSGSLYKTVTSTVTFITATKGTLRLRCRATSPFYVQRYPQTNVFDDSEPFFYPPRPEYFSESSISSKIEVLYPANVSSNISSIAINETDPVILWCSAYGNPLPVITWYHFNEPISSNDNLTITTPSANESHLIINQTRYDRDEGVYTCKATNNVTNLINAIKTHNISLTVQVPPVLTILENSEGPAVVGTNVTLSVNISNAHPPVDRDHITWSFTQAGLNETVVLVKGAKYKFSHNKRNLTIITLTSSDEGEYHITVSHPTGSNSTSISLTVVTNDLTNPLQTDLIITGLSATVLVIAVIIVMMLVMTVIIKKKRQLKHDEPVNYTNGFSNCDVESSLSASINPDYLKTLSSSLMISTSQLKLLDCIGQGEFGKVYKGHYYKGNGQCMTVAVKTLKDILGRYTRDDINELIEETLVMQNFDHPNVMGLIGVCLDAGPAPYIVLPFMAGGNLLNYLTKNRSSLMTSETDDEEYVTQTRTQLLTICLQIAKGMQYIAGQKHVHRDLAARNCMIDDKGVLKVSDFGLSKDVYEHVYFRETMTSGVKLPIKWMAIESIQDGIFTEKTDIWSFGITVWEVFNGGMAPYGGFSPTSVKCLIMDGYRLDPPSLVNTACNEDIYQKIMLKCWEKIPKDRPTFAEIVPEIEAMLSSSAGYLELTLDVSQ